MGRARFYELGPQTVLFTLGRNDGKPEDYHVVDVTAGKILRTLAPVRRGPWAWQDGVFAVVTRSTPEKTTCLNGLDATMGQVIWRHDTFRLACDPLDPHCEPVFSPGAGSDGIVYFSATAKDQPEPPTRQLHAFDARSGTLLWRHTEQPEFSMQHKPGHRSDDGTPIVADGKVIVRLGRYADAARNDRAMSLRALDAKTGAVVWNMNVAPSTLLQGPSWRIGPDGAIYGVSMTGAYRLQ